MNGAGTIGAVTTNGRQSKPALLAALAHDPRHYQIAVLSFLLVYGVGWLGFDIGTDQIAILLGTVLATQFICAKLTGPAYFDPRSPLISGLSLCLLLRANNPLLLFAAAVIAVASKFAVRWNKKHIFNPTNFAIMLMIVVTGDVWVSPAQWGSKLYFAFLMACLGGIIIHRAMRSDVSYAFLAAYAAILFGRAWWLGDPVAIPIKQFQSGALLLFTFHDLRSQNHAGFTRGADSFRARRRRRGRLGSIWVLSHQWTALVTGCRLGTDTAHRLAITWNKISLEQSNIFGT